MKQLLLKNGQRVRRLEVKRLALSARRLLEDLLRLQRYSLAVHFISAERMARLNHDFLDHEGSTDVITFDYLNGYDTPDAANLELYGEIFISVADAVAQSKIFRRPWEEELLRYVVHGILHLRGYDDLTPPERQKMKRAENRLLQALLRMKA